MKDNALPVTRAVIQTVRKLRQDRGLSTRQLAELMTASGYPTKRATLAAAETGLRKEVSIDWIWAVSQALNVSLKVIVQGPDCSGCMDDPPAGFSCNSCGRVSA